MSSWLDPIRQAVAERTSPLEWFVRDDDGGWDDPALARLLDRAEHHGVVIDVAVIPAAIGEMSDRFDRRLDRGAVRLHQHGFAHTNHATSGRKCEFGDDRSVHEIEDDLVRGRHLLTERFGAAVDSIFTPPWNRCSRPTAEALQRLGFEVLSRESGAAPFGIDGLREVPVSFDWSSGRNSTPDERGAVLAEQIRTRPTVGLMLHHAVTSASELDEIDELFGVLVASPVVRMTTIGEAGRQAVGT